MTSHELAKKLLEMPDIAVVLGDSMLGDMSVLSVDEGKYDDEFEPGIRLGF